MTELFTRHVDAASDPGVPVLFKLDDQDKPPLSEEPTKVQREKYEQAVKDLTPDTAPNSVWFWVRQVPGRERRRITRQVGMKRTTRGTVGRRNVIETDITAKEVELSTEQLQLVACYALAGSLNVECKAGDAKSATELTTILGEPVSVGQVISLDKHLKAEDVRGDTLKLLVFDDFYELVPWLIEESDKLRFSAKRDEESLSGN